MFSLDNMEKYNILKPEEAIACQPDGFCLIYGNNGSSNGIYLNENFLKEKNIENHNPKVYNVPSDFCLTGENKFEVEEVEVYQILFE